MERAIDLLLLIRNGKVRSRKDLSRLYGYERNENDLIGGQTLANLKLLKECGLIQIEHIINKDLDESIAQLKNSNDSYTVAMKNSGMSTEDMIYNLLHIQPDYNISVTENLSKLQHTLGFSLTALANDGEESITVKPIFKIGYNITCDNDIFVLMPFNEKYNPVYTDHIKNVLKNFNMSVARADELFTWTYIINDIFRSIKQAKIIIADCTDRNPNVFYEMGIAHTLGKPMILITQNSEDVPFDIKSIRYIKYDYTPRGMKKFEETLSNTLTNVISEISL